MPELEFFFDEVDRARRPDRANPARDQRRAAAPAADDRATPDETDRDDLGLARRIAANAMARPRSSIVGQIRDELLDRQRFLLTSHARPDGDSIGSQLAMAFALDALGKQVRIVNADPAPEHYFEFPGMDRIEIAPTVAPDAERGRGRS